MYIMLLLHTEHASCVAIGSVCEVVIDYLAVLHEQTSWRCVIHHNACSQLLQTYRNKRRAKHIKMTTIGFCTCDSYIALDIWSLHFGHSCAMLTITTHTHTHTHTHTQLNLVIDIAHTTMQCQPVYVNGIGPHIARIPWCPPHC